MRTVGPPETTMPLHQQAARSFHEVVRAHMGLEKIGAQRAICAFLGENTSTYSDYLTGKDGKLDRVAGWIAKWNEENAGSKGMSKRLILITNGERAQVVNGFIPRKSLSDLPTI